MLGRSPKNINLSVPELSEKYSPEIILWSEDEKVVNLCLNYDEKKSSDDEFQESASVEFSDDDKEKLDKRNIDYEFDNPIITVQESGAIKKESGTENPADNELKYDEKKSSDDEFQESASMQLSDDEKEKFDKWNINYEFDYSVMIVQESGSMKKETDTENPAANELNYDSPNPVQPETVQQEEIHIKSKEKKKLNKKIRKPENQVLLHPCPECSYSTNIKSNLNRHLVRHKQEDEVDWYSCPECRYKTSIKGNLKIHAVIHDKLILKCLKCSYKTLRPSSLKRHQKMLHTTNIQWLNCPECSFKSRYLSVLKLHIVAHKSDAFKCPHCPYHTGRKNTLTKHQLKEHESLDKWYSCPLCLFKTHCKNTLKSHCQRRHNADLKNPDKTEIFTCTECSYESGCKSNLKNHQLVHDPRNWFQCSDCAFKTPYKSSLKKHVLRHQGETANGWSTCPKCPYKTVSSSILRRHLIRKHKSPGEIGWFECSQCSFKTTYKNSLSQHQLQHKEAHEIEWFCCYECSYKTKCKGHLVGHISSKHNKTKPTDQFT